MHLIDTTNRISRLLAMPPIRPTVVVVDDDISVRESLELLIENEGWQPTLFESAQEFLAQLPTVVPSCLILDVNLPDLSGLDIQPAAFGWATPNPNLSHPFCTFPWWQARSLAPVLARLWAMSIGGSLPSAVGYSHG
jgi:hypothetical protein